MPFIPARRPTEVLYRPIIPAVPKPPIKLPDIEREKTPPVVLSATKRVVLERFSPRRLSPTKPLPPVGNNVSKRRPIRFDDLPAQTQHHDEL